MPILGLGPFFNRRLTARELSRQPKCFRRQKIRRLYDHRAHNRTRIAGEWELEDIENSPRGVLTPVILYFGKLRSWSNLCNFLPSNILSLQSWYGNRPGFERFMAAA
jgi:hypothetical protein